MELLVAGKMEELNSQIAELTSDTEAKSWQLTQLMTAVEEKV